eukprot:8249864-Alexandrium_andersonii.AAC.1
MAQLRAPEARPVTRRVWHLWCAGAAAPSGGWSSGPELSSARGSASVQLSRPMTYGARARGDPGG